MAVCIQRSTSGRVGYMLSGHTNANFNRAVLGSLSAAWFADKMGRRLTLGITLAVRLVSITLESVSISNPLFFGGRSWAASPQVL
jgi:hypothetical protein